MKIISFENKYKIISKLMNFFPEKSGTSCLMFHSIRNDMNGDIFSVNSKKFEEMVQILKECKCEHLGSIHEKDNKVVVTFDDGFEDNISFAYPILKLNNIPFTIFMISDFVNKEGYLSRFQLQKLSDDPLVTIGIHGKTHNPLLKIDKKLAKEELYESKKEIEEIIGKNVDTMSFPHGSYDDELVDYAMEIGIRKICTSDPGFINKNKKTINRVTIYKYDTIKTFEDKLKGKWEIVKKWI